MKQNKYDDPAFFAGYSAMPRSLGGLAEAGEWPAFRALVPDLAGKRVLDLGCGFGWHCRHAREKGATRVVGVDLSERMLFRARELTADPAILYRLGAIEDLDFPPASFDVVLSSLALHYVADIGGVFARVHLWLAGGGSFLFSVEHPVFTARAEQDWFRGPSGERLHWPLDGYRDEGMRRTAWLADDVVKYHRTVAAWLNTLVDAGFRIVRLAEPEPPAAMVAARPDLADERRRPMFLIVLGTREERVP